MLGMMGLERFIDIWFSATSNKHRGTMGYYEDVMEIDLDMYVCMHACILYLSYIFKFMVKNKQKW